MANRSKAKGSAFELAVARYLAEEFPCERIPAGSAVDRGDLWGPLVAWQCKAVQQLSLGAWLDATEVQAANANRPFHYLVVKRKGVSATTDPGRQFAICSLDQARTITAHLIDTYPPR